MALRIKESDPTQRLAEYEEWIRTDPGGFRGALEAQRQHLESRARGQRLGQLGAMAGLGVIGAGLGAGLGSLGSSLAGGAGQTVGNIAGRRLPGLLMQEAGGAQQQPQTARQQPMAYPGMFGGGIASENLLGGAGQDTLTQDPNAQRGWLDILGGAVPGMIDLGVGIAGQRARQQDLAGQLPRAQQEAQALMEAEQAVMAPVRAKEVQDLQRLLHAQGQGGIGVYETGLPGMLNTGQQVNPQLAALFSAQQAQQSRSAQSALTSSLAAQRQQALENARLGISGPRESNVDIFRQIAQTGRDTGLFGQIGQAVKPGLEWLGGQVGGLFGGGPSGGGFDFGGFGDVDWGGAPVAADAGFDWLSGGSDFDLGGFDIGGFDLGWF